MHILHMHWPTKLWVLASSILCSEAFLFLPQQLYSLQQQGHVYPAWPPPSLTYSSASWCSTLQNCAVSSTFVSLNEILLSTTLYIDNQVYYIENHYHCLQIYVFNQKIYYSTYLKRLCKAHYGKSPVLVQKVQKTYFWCRTVFENHRKSLIQHCERSELRLQFEWTKVN